MVNPETSINDLEIALRSFLLSNFDLFFSRQTKITRFFLNVKVFDFLTFNFHIE